MRSACVASSTIHFQMRIWEYDESNISVFIQTKTSFVRVFTRWKHFRWFGEPAVKQWVISVVDVFGVTTTQCRLKCTLVSLWTDIHYLKATSFQRSPTASHLRLLPEHSRLCSYVSLSKNPQCFCLSLLDLKSDWLRGLLASRLNFTSASSDADLVRIADDTSSSSETDMVAFSGTINPWMNSDAQGFRRG